MHNQVTVRTRYISLIFDLCPLGVTLTLKPSGQNVHSAHCVSTINIHAILYENPSIGLKVTDQDIVV